MTSIPSALAAELALTRQVISLSVVKQSAEAAQALADIIAETARSAPVSSSRGVNVNIRA